MVCSLFTSLTTVSGDTSLPLMCNTTLYNRQADVRLKLKIVCRVQTTETTVSMSTTLLD